MEAVIGKVIRMEEKEASNGGEYTAISLSGKRQSFYDWEQVSKKAGIKAGDTVKVEFEDGEYPRVVRLEKLDSGERAKQDGVCKQRDREARIARMCALKAAAVILQDSDIPYDDQYSEVTSFAEKLEKWIME